MIGTLVVTVNLLVLITLSSTRKLIAKYQLLIALALADIVGGCGTFSAGYGRLIIYGRNPVSNDTTVSQFFFASFEYINMVTDSDMILRQKRDKSKRSCSIARAKQCWVVPDKFGGCYIPRVARFPKIAEEYIIFGILWSPLCFQFLGGVRHPSKEYILPGRSTPGNAYRFPKNIKM